VMYLLGHSLLLLAASLPWLRLAAEGVRVYLAIGTIVLILGHCAWSYSRVFSARPKLAAAGGLASLLGGSLLWILAAALLVRAVVS
jgi:hypothetical protein